MGIQRKILLYMGKSFEISPSEKLTVCHFIRCIFTFSEKEKTEEKMNFREKEQTGTRKKSEKFSAEKEKQKNGRKKGRAEKTQKKMIFEKKLDNEKEDFSKNRIFPLSESKLQERTA